MMPSRALTRGRALAAKLMTDAATITRPGAGAPVFNPATGGYTTPAPTTVYSGPCKVQAHASEVRAVDFGGQAVNLNRLEVHIPVDGTEILAEDTITITSAPYAPALVGQVFAVKGVESKSQATVRRIEAEKVGG